MSDVAHAVHQQTGICDPYDDWMPLSCLAPFSKFLGALRGELIPTLSSHPHCAMGTWNSLRKHYREDRAPEGLTLSKFLETL
jgi:uncharacterized radical SAM superfamily Fe-S cluster-containing enzyme